MSFCDLCPRKPFDVESGFFFFFLFLLEICNKLWMNISAIIWTGRRCVAVPAATNCLLFEIVPETKSHQCRLYFAPPHRRPGAKGEFSSMLFPSLKILSLLCDSYRTWRVHPEACECVCVRVCRWFVHHQWLLLFEDNSTCLHCTWLVLPQHQNQFSPPSPV